MPKLIIPSYRLHRGSGQAVITIAGRDIYLGVHDTPESRAKYEKVIAEWLVGGRRLPVPQKDISIAEMVEAFWTHAEQHYRHADGTPTSEVSNFREALKPLIRLYAADAAASFGPLALKAVRLDMIRTGWCRKVINRAVSRIKHVFKYGVENELIPGIAYEALRAVGGLQEGRTDARENAPVQPVPVDMVEAALPFMAGQVAAMVRLQMLTGMRPGEVTAIRGCDLETPADELWRYRPRTHKTQYRGHERIVYLGPQAQEIVNAWLRANPQDYLFAPRDAEEERRAGDGEGEERSSRAKRWPKKTAGARYSVGSYCRAIHYACSRAFPAPERLAKQRVAARGRKEKSTRFESDVEAKLRLERAKPGMWAERLKWIEDHRFHPHQLRHTAGTILRQKYGLEAAQVILGHRTLSATQIYAERNVEAAKRIMGQVG